MIQISDKSQGLSGLGRGARGLQGMGGFPERAAATTGRLLSKWARCPVLRSFPIPESVMGGAVGGGGSRGDGKITRDLGGREDRWPDQNLQEEDIYKK